VIRAVSAGIVLTGSLFAAHAVPVVYSDWGVHDLGESISPFAEVGTFEHIVEFTLEGSFAASALTYGITVDPPPVGSPILAMNSGTVELYKVTSSDGNYQNDLNKGSYNFTDAQSRGSFGNLDAGSYFYRVTGVATGSFGGLYTLSSTMTPLAVPEPGTLAMLLAGLGVMGLLSRRRLPR
jgi:PEP-CTERM motif